MAFCVHAFAEYKTEEVREALSDENSAGSSMNYERFKGFTS